MRYFPYLCTANPPNSGQLQKFVIPQRRKRWGFSLLPWRRRPPLFLRGSGVPRSDAIPRPVGYCPVLPVFGRFPGLLAAKRGIIPLTPETR